MRAKVELTFDLRKIKLNLAKELNFAGDIIVKDHFTRLEQGLDVNQKRMKELSGATIEKKGFDQILVDQDKMRRLVRSRATKDKQFVDINPGTKQKRGKNKLTNIQIGAAHQSGRPGLPKREWFGISKKAEEKCLKLIEKRIDRLIKDA